MPINYKHYHPKWTLIRRLILRRAQNKCELCGVKNKYLIERDERNKAQFRYLDFSERLGIQDEIQFGNRTKREILKDWGYTQVVLTIAHMDQNKDNNRFWNLKALCQRCHLVHDRKAQASNRKYGKSINQLSLF